MGPELMDNMRQQAERFGAEFRTGWVNSVEFGERPFKLDVDGMGEVIAETLIISTGATAKYLGIPGEQDNVGRGVSTCATCDGFFFRGKEIVVVGGGIPRWRKRTSDPLCIQSDTGTPSGGASCIENHAGPRPR